MHALRNSLHGHELASNLFSCIQDSLILFRILISLGRKQRKRTGMCGYSSLGQCTGTLQPPVAPVTVAVPPKAPGQEVTVP